MTSLWDGCTDPDLSRLPTDVSITLCNGQLAHGQLNLEDLTPEQIVTGKTIAGVAGTMPSSVVVCNSEGQTDCLTSPSFTAAQMTAAVPGNIRSNVNILGVTGTYDAITPACTSDGAIDCLTTSSYQSADFTQLIPGNIKNGVVVAGVMGAYPSASAILEGATTVTDLMSLDAGNVAGNYEFFDSLGQRYTGSIVEAGTISPGVSAVNYNSGIYRQFTVPGNNNLTGANIKSGATIFGVNGVMTPAPADCGANGATACVTTSTYKAADLSNLTAGNIRNGVTIAGVAGQYPSAAHPLVGSDATTDLPALASTVGGATYEWFQSDGTRITDAVQADVTATPGGSAQIFNAGVYRSVTASGDAALLATNIRSGVQIFSVTGSVAGAPADCSANAQTGCVTTAAYQAADLTNLTAASVKNGVTLAGVTGTYPSASARLATNTAATDLISLAATTVAGSYEFFDSTGAVYSGSIADAGSITAGISAQNFNAAAYRQFTVNGSAAFIAGNIKSGVDLFGITGVQMEAPSNCNASAAVGCVTTSTYKGADLSNLTAGNIKNGVTIAGVAGQYPSAIYLLAGNTAATDLPAFASATGGSSYEWFQSDGSRIADAVETDPLVTPSATDQTLNAGLYRSVTVAGDADITAANVRSGITLFGVTGTLVPSQSPCTLDGETDCVVTGSFKSAANAQLLAANIKDGITLGGVAGSLTGAPANCTANGATGCVTTATYKSADLTNLSAGNIKSGVNIAGVTGTYPSAGARLASNTAATDLVSLAASTAAGNYEFFDSTGAVYSGTISDAATITAGTSNQNFSTSVYRQFTVSGDADLVAANIRAGTDILGVTGTATPSPADCSGDGVSSCVTTSTYKSADTGAFSASDLKSGKTVAGVAGTLPDCASDGSGSCVVNGTTYKAARLSNFVVADVKSGVTIAGVAGSATLESHSNCAADAATGCVTTASYPAANAANTTAGNIKSGVTINAVAGQYPSATYPLPGAVGGTADLTNATFSAQVKSATAFEYWDSAGARQTGSGDANIVAAKLTSGTTVFGTAGSVTVESHSACASDGASGCYTDGTNYKAAKLSNFVGTDIKSGVTIATVAGSGTLESHINCAVDAATGCVTTASYPAASNALATAGNIKAGVTIAGVLGQYPSATYPLGSASATADLTNSTFSAQARSATAFEYWDSAGAYYTGNGDSNIVAAKILTGNSIFGTAGSVIAESHSACATDGGTSCIPDGTAYKAARLSNFTAADVKTGVTIAAVPGTATFESHSACASDGASNCVVNGTTYKAASTSTAIAANIKSGVTIAGVIGGFPSATNTLTGADSTADLVSGTFNAQMKSATAFEWFDSVGNRYTNTGDVDIKAGLIATGVDIFGTTGTYSSSNVSASGVSATQGTGKVTLAWSRTGTGVIVVKRAGAATSWVPTNGTSYSTGSVDANHSVIYAGTALTFDDTSVTNATTYYYQVFAYNADYGYSGAGGNTASIFYATSPVCGAVGDNCYSDSAATTAGSAVTPSGKTLTYVTASGSFKVWKDTGSNKILRANGLDEWAMKLNTSGKGQMAAGNEFVSYTNLVGRVCPTNVYIDDTTKFSTGNCVYYTRSASTQRLDKDGTDNVNGMSSWSSQKWMYGNILACNQWGMRLPTWYENSSTWSSTGLPTGDGTPTGFGTGVPYHPSGCSWTATTSSSTSQRFSAWDDNSSSLGVYSYNSCYVQCVLP